MRFWLMRFITMVRELRQANSIDGIPLRFCYSFYHGRLPEMACYRKSPRQLPEMILPSWYCNTAPPPDVRQRFCAMGQIPPRLKGERYLRRQPLRTCRASQVPRTPQGTLFSALWM